MSELPSLKGKRVILEKENCYSGYYRCSDVVECCIDNTVIAEIKDFLREEKKKVLEKAIKETKKQGTTKVKDSYLTAKYDVIKELLKEFERRGL